LGATHLAVVCVPAVDGVAVAPCGVFDGQALAPSVIAQPSLTQETVNAVEVAARPIDYSEAGGFFASSFGIVIVLFLLGHGIGSVLKVFDR
jgi:hypothetical protein